MFYNIASTHTRVHLQHTHIHLQTSHHSRIVSIHSLSLSLPHTLCHLFYSFCVTHTGAHPVLHFSRVPLSCLRHCPPPRLSGDQCDRIGLFWMVWVIKYLTKIAKRCSGAFLNSLFHVKTDVATFCTIYQQFGLLIFPASGHTGFQSWTGFVRWH